MRHAAETRSRDSGLYTRRGLAPSRPRLCLFSREGYSAVIQLFLFERPIHERREKNTFL